MNVEGFEYRLVGTHGDYWFGNVAVHSVVFRPKWSSHNDYSGSTGPRVTFTVGSRVLKQHPSSMDYKYAAKRWHVVNQRVLVDICQADLFMLASEYDYTILNGFDFAFVFRNHLKAIQFKLMVSHL